MNNDTGNDSYDGQSAVWDGISGPKLSIKSAAGTVDAGGIVHLADGIYTGADNRNINLDRSMTVIGQSKQGIIIDAQWADRIFIIPGGVSVTLQNLTIINGRASDGGDSKFFAGGSGSDGGAIFNTGTLQINDCLFSGSSAGDGGHSTFTIGGNGGYGGAIYNAGTLQINNSIFENNHAGSGGGSSWAVGGNGGHGGAIHNAGTLQINNSIFKENSAGNEGSGWAEDGGPGKGGAIHSARTLQISSSIIENNNAGQYCCGGIATDGGTALINFNVIVGNTNGDVVTYDGGSVNATLNYWGTYSKA